MGLLMHHKNEKWNILPRQHMLDDTTQVHVQAPHFGHLRRISCPPRPTFGAVFPSCRDAYSNDFLRLTAVREQFSFCLQDVKAVQ